MHHSRLVKNFLAIVFLVLLSQKIGFGLFVHNASHSQFVCKNSSGQQVTLINFHCNCIDDFSMPFTSAVDGIQPVVDRIYSNFITPTVEQLPQQFQFFSSLRGPPANDC